METQNLGTCPPSLPESQTWVDGIMQKVGVQCLRTLPTDAHHLHIYPWEYLKLMRETRRSRNRSRHTLDAY